MNINRQKLTLDRPAVYQIRVPGQLDENWLECVGQMSVETSYDQAGLPITTLTGQADQAALMGLLRHLYALGLPLISVNWLEG